MSLSKYRLEIDGLRAIAVISVIVFHAFANVLPGGFLGVDVFFVISGFLITSILLRETGEGHFSLWSFYERRIRRLIPPLIPVLVFSTTCAWVLFSPLSLIEYSKSLLATVGYVANWFFYFDSGYFDAPAHSKPLLHMWSLGVEEQYYMFFPLLLMVFMPRVKLTNFLIVSLTLLSLALSLYWSRNAADLAFYSTMSRFWELGIGSILATTLIPQNKNKIISDSLSFLGLILIAISLFTGLHQQGVPFPSALPATIGTALVIWGTKGRVNLVTTLLSLPLMTYIGKISYSLYLWHWPVLVFAKYVFPQPRPAIIIGAVGLSVLLSILSYHFIEGPVRQKKILAAPKKLVGSFIGLVVAFALFGVFTMQTGGLSNSEPAIVQDYEKKLLASKVQFMKQAGRWTCWSQKQDEFEKRKAACLQPKPLKTNLLIIGDSHSGQLYTPFKESYPNMDVSLMVNNSCSMIKRMVPASRTVCHSIIDFLSDTKNIEPFDYVILGSRMNRLNKAEEYLAFMNQLTETYDGEIILIGPIHYYQPGITEIFPKHMEKSSAEIDTLLDEAIDDMQFEVDSLMQKLSADNPKIQYVSTLKVLCPRGKTDCRHFGEDGMPVLVDGTHMTAAVLSEVISDLRNRGELVIK